MSNILSIDCTANIDNGVANLLAVYSRANRVEIQDGMQWYSSAHDEARRISDMYHVPMVTVVKVACALSPRLEWSRNMPAAESVIRWFVSGGYVPDIATYASFGGSMLLQRTRHSAPDTAVIADDPRLPVIAGPTRVNVVKALWILQGHTAVLRGKKVSSFCDNILNHAISTAVTVDSHAIQCWFGKMEEGTYAVPPSFYAIIEADYQRAAAIVGCTPLQFQAIVWVAKKRITADNKRAAAMAKKQAAAMAKVELRAMLATAKVAA
jgi:hypothetical protein